MAKTKRVYFCQNCGTESAKWVGRCGGCGEWNTLVEEVISKKSNSNSRPVNLTPSLPQTIAELAVEEIQRIHLKMGELNRVLGGGAVPGSVVLIGGDPGIGKSTLTLQALNYFSHEGFSSLYVSGEESAQQIRMRAERMAEKSPELLVLTENSLEAVSHHLEKQKPKILCIDSIQTLYSEELESAAGSVGQVRYVTAKLVEYAKRSGCIIFLIGHVTKEGSIAGPRVLEHMVDTVLYFETTQGHTYRILRAIKNRFGSTNEIGVFEMTGIGLMEVKNPSEFFLSERTKNAPGSVVTITLEGSRPILVEIQSLTIPGYGGPPRRTCIGVDSNRVSLLAAVIQRELNLSLSDQDLYVNIAGGIRLDEPAVDLGLVTSIASSRLKLAISSKMAVFGEVGLTGEIRAIEQPALRIQEAKKLGFSQCVIPKNNLNRLAKEQNIIDSIDIIGIQHIREILPHFVSVTQAPQKKSENQSVSANA